MCNPKSELRKLGEYVIESIVGKDEIEDFYTLCDVDIARAYLFLTELIERYSIQLEVAYKGKLEEFYWTHIN